MVEGSFGDVEGRERGEEIVPHEHPQQHKVVDDPLDAELEGELSRKSPELEFQVVPEQPAGSRQGRKEPRKQVCSLL